MACSTGYQHPFCTSSPLQPHYSLKKSRGLLREEQLLSFVFAEKANHTIARLCRVLELNRSSYYASLKSTPTLHDLEDDKLRPVIKSIFSEHKGRYGRPRVMAELVSRGINTSAKRVARLMREEGLVSTPPKRFIRTTNSNHKFPKADNLLQRDFTATSTNQKWVGDLTYLWTAEGWMYLATLQDVFSKTIVGWSLKTTMDESLSLDALVMALRGRKTKGLIHHTDQGAQYAATKYRTVLKSRGIKVSMSRKGDCWDNAMAESLNGTIKRELLGEWVPKTRAELESAVLEYIEGYYNKKRRHSALGYKTPLDVELNIAKKRHLV